MIEHKSFFYNLNYPGPLDAESPESRLDDRMNQELREGWVPYATIPAGEDRLAGYILMTRRTTTDFGTLVDELFQRGDGPVE